MDALNMAAVSSLGTLPGSRPSNGLDVDGSRLSPRMRAALALLFEAYHYAQDLDTSVWDFATEISALRRLKLSNSDLRWLVGRGLIEHGVEVTLASDEERSFQHPSRLMFTRRTCFVLLPAGAALAHELVGTAPPPSLAEARLASDPPALAIASPSQSELPKWDRDRQELRVGATVVRQFKIPSAHEETILAAFEEQQWPPRIEDPLPGSDDPSPPWRLQEAIESLNRNLRHVLLRFRGDSTGRSVLWEHATSATARDH